jgi:hypothetical protein
VLDCRKKILTQSKRKAEALHAPDLCKDASNRPSQAVQNLTSDQSAKSEIPQQKQVHKMIENPVEHQCVNKIERDVARVHMLRIGPMAGEANEGNAFVLGAPSRRPRHAEPHRPQDNRHQEQRVPKPYFHSPAAEDRIASALVTLPLSGIVQLLQNPKALEFARVCADMFSSAATAESNRQAIVNIATALESVAKEQQIPLSFDIQRVTDEEMQGTKFDAGHVDVMHDDTPTIIIDKLHEIPLFSLLSPSLQAPVAEDMWVVSLSSDG